MNPLQEQTYKDYRISNLFGGLSPTLGREIVELWVGCGALDQEMARTRVKQVLFAIRNSAGELVGVNTVYRDELPRAGAPYYFMRMFIHPRERRDPGLSALVSRLTREFLATLPGSGAVAPRGLVIVTENRKYWRRGGQRFLARNGWRFLEKSPEGAETWYINFDGSLLPEAGGKD